MIEEEVGNVRFLVGFIMFVMGNIIFFREEIKDFTFYFILVIYVFI